MEVLASALFVAIGVAMLCGVFDRPGKPPGRWDAALGVVTIAFFGWMGALSAREFFGERRVRRTTVVLDDKGVLHPNYEKLVPWRDITGVFPVEANASADGPKVPMLRCSLILGTDRYIGSYDIHASNDEEAYHPPMLWFGLGLSPIPPEEVLAFAKEKIAAHRA